MITEIADCETDGFLDTMTRLWTIQLKRHGSTEPPDVYADQPGFRPLSEALTRLQEADRVVFHNGIRSDYWAINKVYPGALRREQVFDTLVAARLMDPEERKHSLEAWGKRLGLLKGNYTGDFQSFTPELVEYAIQDVVVGEALYDKVRVVETWGESCALEHQTAWAIDAQQRNGFQFDVKAAKRLETELRAKIEAEKLALRDVFPARWMPERKGGQVVVFTPKGNNAAHGYTAGAPLTKVYLEVFNPASRQQVASRLMDLGWKPHAFGKDGSPTVDEDILAALPWPEAKRLVEFFTLNKRLGQLSDGKSGWLKMVRPDGRVYGAVNTNGAVTGRMSHFAPNMAQVDTEPAMRALWIARPGWKLVGCDAEGLEARMLAHFLARFDGGAFTERLINGRKEDGTDVHSANRDAVKSIGYPVNRDGAKTLLYALIYGAGDSKLGQTVTDNLRAQGLTVPKGNPKTIGIKVRRALATSMKGIDKVTEKLVELKRKQGWFRGLDGRHVVARSEHSILNTLLQGGGAIVMKKALCIFMSDYAPLYEGRFGMCANVHDEVQMEAEPNIAEDLGKAFANCITASGQHFGLRCPFAGSYDVGNNWSETH